VLNETAPLGIILCLSLLVLTEPALTYGGSMVTLLFEPDRLELCLYGISGRHTQASRVSFPFSPSLANIFPRFYVFHCGSVCTIKEPLTHEYALEYRSA